MDAISVQPIGFVTSSRTMPIDDDWDTVTATITLDAKRFTPDALSGLNSFSHVDLIYQFHLVPEATIENGSRHPHGRKDWPKVGIFAQRAKDRPNRLGVTTCRLLSVSGLTLSVSGLDAIDGTPILDIKPTMHGFLPRGELKEPAWAAALMKGYW